MNHIPVLLITFNRPEHTRQSLESILVQKPEELYIFQDGPRDGNLNDVQQCRKVQDIVDKHLDSLNYDIKLHKCYSDINRGCRDAIIYAISSVFKEHDAVIVIEDDIITSTSFLTYMNNALNYYKDNKSVHSISGHLPRSIQVHLPADYPYDVFASPRLFNWGWGTWRDRWENVDWTMSYFDVLMSQVEMVNAFNRGGDDMTPMLIDEREGRSSAWDIQFAFDQFKNHKVSIVPMISYTYNIGCDGSGTHCASIKETVIEEFVMNTKVNIKWIDILYYDRRIINALHNAFTKKRRPLWQKAINFISRKLGKKTPFVIKKKVFV